MHAAKRKPIYPYCQLLNTSCQRQRINKQACGLSNGFGRELAGAKRPSRSKTANSDLVSTVNQRNYRIGGGGGGEHLTKVCAASNEHGDGLSEVGHFKDLFTLTKNLPHRFPACAESSRQTDRQVTHAGGRLL